MSAPGLAAWALVLLRVWLSASRVRIPVRLTQLSALPTGDRLSGSLRPFTTTEWAGLREFCQLLQPRYRPCGRTKCARLFADYAERVTAAVGAEVKAFLETPGAQVWFPQLSRKPFSVVAAPSLEACLGAGRRGRSPSALALPALVLVFCYMDRGRSRRMRGRGWRPAISLPSWCPGLMSCGCAPRGSSLHAHWGP